MVKQKLRERYIDKNLLDRLLRGLFGNGNFEIEVLYRPPQIPHQTLGYPT